MLLFVTFQIKLISWEDRFNLLYTCLDICEASDPLTKGRKRGEGGSDGIEYALNPSPVAFLAFVRDDPLDALRKQRTCAGDVAGNDDPCSVVISRGWQYVAVCIGRGKQSAESSSNRIDISLDRFRRPETFDVGMQQMDTIRWYVSPTLFRQQFFIVF